MVLPLGLQKLLAALQVISSYSISTLFSALGLHNECVICDLHQRAQGHDGQGENFLLPLFLIMVSRN